MGSTWDKSFSFTVGSDERHEVSVHWAQGPAEILVEVDGSEALRERHPLGVKRVRRYEVVVGDSESHTVVVEKRKATLAGGVREQSFLVHVDGLSLGEY